MSKRPADVSQQPINDGDDRIPNYEGTRSKRQHQETAASSNHEVDTNSNRITASDELNAEVLTEFNAVGADEEENDGFTTASSDVSFQSMEQNTSEVRQWLRVRPTLSLVGGDGEQGRRMPRIGDGFQAQLPPPPARVTSDSVSLRSGG